MSLDPSQDGFSDLRCCHFHRMASHMALQEKLANSSSGSSHRPQSSGLYSPSFSCTAALVYIFSYRPFHLHRVLGLVEQQSFFLGLGIQPSTFVSSSSVLASPSTELSFLLILPQRASLLHLAGLDHRDVLDQPQTYSFACLCKFLKMPTKLGWKPKTSSSLPPLWAIGD